jgi:hypothetical protein
MCRWEPDSAFGNSGLSNEPRSDGVRVPVLDSHFYPSKTLLMLLLQSGLPDLSQVTEASCYYGLGVALLKFESAVCQLEASIEAGQKVR